MTRKLKDLRGKKELELDLEKLGSIIDMQLKESEASCKISGLEKKIQYAKIEKLEIVTKARASRILSLENSINDIMDRIYKNFSKSVGVSNIREYEENNLKEVEQMADETHNLYNQQ